MTFGITMGVHSPPSVGAPSISISVAAKMRSGAARGRGTGRIRMSRVEDVAARSLIPFVQTTVAPAAAPELSAPGRP